MWIFNHASAAYSLSTLVFCTTYVVLSSACLLAADTLLTVEFAPMSLALLSFEDHWLYFEVIRGEYEMFLMLALICWGTCASWSSDPIRKNFKIINLDMLLKKICIGKILTSKVRPLDQHLKDHFIKDEVKKKEISQI